MATSDNSVTVRRRNAPESESTVAESNGAAPPAQDQQQQQQQPQEPVWKTVLYRIVTFWVVMQLIRSFTGQNKQTAVDNSGKSVNPMVCNNIFRTGDEMELYIYWSEAAQMQFDGSMNLLWHESSLVFGNWYDGPNSDGVRSKSGYIDIPESVQNNGSLYYHMFLVKRGYSPDPSSKFYSRYSVVNVTKLMSVYRKQRVHKTKNLLTGTADAQQELLKNDTDKVETISFWHSNLTINVLDDQTPWTRGSLPAPLDQYIIFDRLENFYYPVLYPNDYWNYISEYMPINSTTPKLEFHITYSLISMFKWQMYISQNMRSQWNQYLGDTQETSDNEQDMIKRTLRETNPYLLGLTMIVSLVHSVFEFLAFKNDIQFWKTRKSLEGLSVRSVFYNVFQSLVVLLYVTDNETNMIVVFSCFVGLVIEIWKITKVVDIKRDPNRMWGPFPAFTMTDKSTYVESETKVYDRLAFRYLSWLLFPLCICYGIYSLTYNEHKGWYSFALSVAYGFLLTFGFIMMTPQLFINYKLKSVAHLPWRMLTYKALNTFIDDIFAFVIKMPTLYRIGCLRDDVIFFIFLYQKYIYPIDHSRVNEFGITGEEAEQVSGGDGTKEIEESKESNADTAVKDSDTNDSPSAEEGASVEQTEQLIKEIKTDAIETNGSVTESKKDK